MLNDDHSVGSNIRDIREQLGISKVCLAEHWVCQFKIS